MHYKGLRLWLYLLLRPKKLVRYALNSRPENVTLSFLDNKKRLIYLIEYTHGDLLDGFFIYHRGRTIGRVQLSWHDDCLELADIVIWPEFPEYRGDGIGTQMFRQVVDVANRQGRPTISGRIKAEDPTRLDQTKRLVNFYLKQGCEIEGKMFVYRLSAPPQSV